MSGLTPEQNELYKQLEGAIKGREQIDQILQPASADNLRAVLTAAGTEYSALEYGQSYILTLLGYAIYENNQEGVQAILAAANDKGILKEVLNSNITIKKSESDIRTLTPLDYAIHENNQKSIEAILNAIEDKDVLKEVLTKANIIITLHGYKYTLTSLGYAIYKNDQKGVQAILTAADDKGILEEVLNSNITVDSSYKSGFTSTTIEFATRVRDREEIQDVLNAANKKASTLHYAVKSNNLGKVQTLLQKRVDINQKDENGYTVLHIAAANGYAKIVEALLKVKGINVNAQTMLMHKVNLQRLLYIWLLKMAT